MLAHAWHVFLLDTNTQMPDARGFVFQRHDVSLTYQGRVRLTCWAIAQASVIVAIANSTAVAAALLLDNFGIGLVARYTRLFVVSMTPGSACV
jgi:hypothetical protein